MKKYIVITLDGSSVETDDYTEFQGNIDRLFELQKIEEGERYYEIYIESNGN